MNGITKFIGICARTLVRLFVWVLTGIVVLACLAVLRLVVAPVDLQFVRADIDQQLQVLMPGWDIRYEKATLGWDWRLVGPIVRVSDIALAGYDDTFIGRVPEAEVVLSSAVLLGNVHVKSARIGNSHLDLSDPLALVDSADAAPAEAPSDDAEVAAQGLFDGPFRANSLAPVAAVVARIADRLNAAFPELDVVQVASLDIMWRQSTPQRQTRITLPRLNLARRADTIVIDTQADVELGGTPVRVQIEAYALPPAAPTPGIEDGRGTTQTDPAAGAARAQLNLSISDVRLNNLSERIAFPDIISAVKLPIHLALGLQINTVEGLEVARYEMDLGTGSLSHPELYPKAAPVQFGRISGRYNSREERFVLSDVTVDTGSAVIKGDGEVFWEEGASRPSGRISARVAKARVADVVAYWPVARHPDGRPRSARDWIDRNIIRGGVSDIDFTLQWDKDGQGPFRQGSLFDLRFSFAGIDSFLIETMPPIRDAHGSAQLIESAFKLTIDGGNMEGVEMRKSRMLLDGLNVPNADTGYFHVHLAGTMENILPVIDHRPVRLSRRMSTSFDRFRGRAEIWADVVVPLSGFVTTEDVSFEIEAAVDDFEFDRFLDGPGIRDGDMVVTVGQNALALKGMAKINGTPLSFEAREELQLAARDPEAQSFTAALRGSWRAAEFQGFKADITPWVDGTLSGEMRLRGRSFTPNRASFDMDVSDASITLDQLGWQKQAGVPARISGSLDILDQSSIRVNDVNLLGEGMDATINLGLNTITDDSLVVDAVIRKLGENSFRLGLEQVDDGPYEIDLRATRLDIRPFLGPVKDAKKRAELEAREGDLTSDIDNSSQGDPADDADNEKSLPDLVLRARAREILMLNQESITEAEMSFTFAGGEPRTGLFEGNISRNRAPVSLTLAPGDEVRSLVLNTNDGGGLLRSVGLFAHAVGGRLAVEGTTYGWGDGLRIDIVSKLRDARVLGLNELEEALGNPVEYGNINDLEEFVDKGGMRLDKADVPMFYHGGLIDFEDVIANGPSLGITLEGQLHTKLNKININGVVVPAYGVNSLLGNIPIIGAIFTGGEGKGLFAVPYRVKGDMSDPDVTVATATAAVPGIFREIFTGSKGTIEDVQKDEAKAAEKQAKKDAQKDAQKKGDDDKKGGG